MTVQQRPLKRLEDDDSDTNEEFQSNTDTVKFGRLNSVGRIFLVKRRISKLDL